jgi:hypothetical protein
MVSQYDQLSIGFMPGTNEIREAKHKIGVR